MNGTAPPAKSGLWMALAAAILGWMFDGFEMGLFPLAARPALLEMLAEQGVEASVAETQVGGWIGVMTAGFLIGASTGGVLFGWLGDRLGRVRAMMLSVLGYALFSGLCGFATTPEQLFGLRFLAALGMGGEWSLGVSLVMELWPNTSRGWLAGLIGAAANVGFILVALLSLGLSQFIGRLQSALDALGVLPALVETLTANSGWRLLMMCGAVPALLTFFIRLFVPESERWREEHRRGATGNWSTADLLAVVAGTAAALGIIVLWSRPDRLGLDARLDVQIPGTALGLAAAYFGYTWPVRKYLQRSAQAPAASSRAGDSSANDWPPRRVLGRMLIGATLSGVALLGTWASIQNGPPWANKLAEQAAKKQGLADEAVKKHGASAAAMTQIASGVGAVVGCIVAPLIGSRIGRRLSYVLLCVLALGAAQGFFLLNDSFGGRFLMLSLAAGACTASFYGWLPLYLPELFPTRVRAFGQGFAFNFGRIIAAVGSLQFGYLMKEVFDGSYPQTCSVLSLIYLAGMLLVWLAPETQGQPLPE